MDVEIKFPPEVVIALQTIATNLTVLADLQKEMREEQKKLAAIINPTKKG